MEITLVLPVENSSLLADIFLLLSEQGLSTDETAEGALAKARINNGAVRTLFFNTKKTEEQ